MRTQFTAVLLACLFFSPLLQARGDENQEKNSDLKILLITPDAERGKRFQEFFTQQKMTCAVVGYDAVTIESVNACDLIITDTPEGPQKAVFGDDYKKALDALKTFPKTEKPVLGIGLYGVQALKSMGVGLTAGYV